MPDLHATTTGSPRRWTCKKDTRDWRAWDRSTRLLDEEEHLAEFDGLRQSWAKSLPVHLAGATAFTIAHVAAITSVRWWLWLNEPKSTFYWPQAFKMTLLQYFDWESITYWAIVGLSLAAMYYHESQEKALKASQLETRLVEAQLHTLQRQLQPHFLFNTLHAISALMHKDVEQADRMITRLSVLLRLALDKVGVAEVRVRDEIEFLEKYLQIEQTRFQDRLSVNFEVHPETLDAKVPTLLLQPLVENAIKPAVAPRPGPGTIDIRVRRENSWLRMEVRDNGGGRGFDALTALQKGERRQLLGRESQDRRCRRAHRMAGARKKTALQKGSQAIRRTTTRKEAQDWRKAMRRQLNTAGTSARQRTLAKNAARAIREETTKKEAKGYRALVREADKKR